MKFTTEDEIELYNLKLLESLGYSYRCGYDIQPEGQHQERKSFSDILLKDRLQNAITKLNPDIPLEAREEAFRQITTLNTPDFLNNNETFHKYLTEGIEIDFQWNGESRGGKVWLIDFNYPENNEFLAVNQFTVIEDNHNRRPDIILFINGLPLVVIELKNASDDTADLKAAYNQLQTYKREIPSLFTYNTLLIISDGLKARAGSLSADFNRFQAWKTPDIEDDLNRNELGILTNGILNKPTLLDLIRHFTVFEKIKKIDPQTEVITLETVKKIAAYHQYYAVNKAVESVIKASSETGDGKGGVVWHTQGSGKSLSMVFLTGKLVLTLNNPTVVVLTDRNDLDDQLFDTFAGCRQLLRQEPQQADNRSQLRELLTVDAGGIVFTTVQKFSPENDENIYPEISPRTNIIVLADEAHRSQYGFKARQVNIKDAEGKVIGKQTKYGFAKYIRDALPHATFVGFTGTPVEETDKNTPAIFGDYIDIYDIAQAVKDGATVPIYYEGRLVKVDLDENGRKLLDELDEDLQYEDLTTTQKAKANQTQLEAIVGSTERLRTIAKDIVTHFEQRQTVNRGKGMIVTMSRRIAADLYEKIIELRPNWHSDDLDTGIIKVVMTAAASDEEKLVKHHTSKKDRQILAKRLKDPDNSLQLVIVCDMWLTGFDAPCLHTMYIDKPLKSHNLMQAIARINRVYFDKMGGLIVDYLGFAQELKQALSFYSQSGGRGNIVVDQQEAVGVFLTQLEIVEQIMAGCPYQHYFTASTGDKLNLLKTATNYIADPSRKTQFQDAVVALSKAFSLAVPHPDALREAEKLSFFQAIQASLKKLEISDGGVSNIEIETAIRQVVDQALVSSAVINIFDEAGIKNPDLSIISDEFMEEVQGMEHKNLAVELLTRLLKDEVKAKSRTNIVQSRKLAEMLEEALRRYQNQVISVTDIIEELLGIARDTQAANKRGEELNLEPYELAFYDALAQNESARDVMGVEQLRELAIVLVQRIRQNATIDWNLKENVRARMKVMVKRLLREYGYPPDMQALATELVLEQAKVFTASVVS
ncbi:type I restriction endonuclease subunit R [Ancylothrix sp. C2]|uniref:type I restriction endonuclease subunit R n=1 Tax=Ancylothrix sp. D3o TaxID=2953691 RepID=UPI0021BB0210|nr:type I restriction endonuclease subunit R [Ancylothrix sp. D3o]MCT7952963.1 type I restriction endonuclease subunit R [Ancylothrix sp. D3o]